MNGAEKVKLLLEVIRDEILPLTESETARGNVSCGSAILRADTLTSVMVGADNRSTNPIFHGNIDSINRFFKLPVHPPAEELIFLATHAPCPMCAAAIAWSGFKELWILFGHDEVETEPTLLPSLAMYRDLFGVEGIRNDNGFYTRHSIKKQVATSPNRDELQALLDDIDRAYAALRKG
ncbi:MAG: nucleoside deaminase [Synergistaceae bacterium]|nr:nucleoside deaminase [Synergistaceae bacterium]